ncbi:rhotekin-2-like [Bolinopsis microptera]|uniref:rhotekin-2-like n=1 Tax=Bolinopsis microptera TaxID=2820187 RepID=UPI0030795469
MTALQKEHVKEVEDAHGLTDLKDKDELLREEMMESVSLADVTISNIIVPLKWCRIDHNKYKTDCWKYQVFCLIRSGIQVLDCSELTKVDILTENIQLKDTFVLKDMGPDFVIDLEFYYTQTEDPVKKKDKKKAEQTEAPAPVFAIAATASLSLAHCNIWSQKAVPEVGC